MSYVASNPSTRQQIHYQIDRMKENEYKLFGEEPPLKIDPASDWLEHLVWGEHQPLKSLIPTDWMAQHERVIINVKGSVDDEGTEHEYRLNFTFEDLINFPPGAVGYEAYDMHLAEAPQELLDVVLPHIKYLQNRRECAARWNKVKKDVNTFVERCKSLNEAVKLWPDVRNYIPTRILDKLDEKKDKAAKRDTSSILDGIDIDELTTAAVVSKLAENV